MSHFKDTNNQLHFLDNDDFAYLLPAGSVKVTDDEAKAIQLANNPPPDPQLEINAVARAYLAETDWYVIRLTETGVAIPADVIDQRALSRSAIL